MKLWEMSAPGVLAIWAVMASMTSKPCSSSPSFAILKKVLEKKLKENTCQSVNESSPKSFSTPCLGMCNASNTACRGFTLTCPDLDPPAGLDLDLLFNGCHCLQCSNEDLGQVTSGKIITDKVTVPTTTVSTTTLTPQCSPPPLIDRTAVTHTVTSTQDVAHYVCSDSTDVYVSGTTDVTCKLGETWPPATILCAPTTCWFKHPTTGPLYAGTLTVGKEGKPCQPWALNEPQSKNSKYDDDKMYPSDGYSRAAAQNRCRIFNDGYEYVWCYWNETASVLRQYGVCDVEQCPTLSGVRLN